MFRQVLSCFIVLLACPCLMHLRTIGQVPSAPPSPSPEIHSDRTVSFRLRAPEAHRVELVGQFLQGKKEMEKTESGVWVTTVGPVAPNLYPYHFVVDGTNVADPQNQDVFPNERFKSSLVDIPGETPSLHAMRDVPHGSIEYCYYQSKSIGGTRPLLVYTPPEYKHKPESYPVLYLVSGTTDTEETWFRAGRIHNIMDNLIAEKKSVPMVVVMPYGNTLTGTPRPDTPEAATMYQKFSDDMTGSVMPYVESNFRVATDRSKRAIAGFSRGGGQSLFTAFSNLDKFSSVGSFSAYLTPQVMETHFGRLLEDPSATNQKLDLLWMGVGKTDFLYERAVEFENFLTTKKIQHESLITDGGHTWMNARHYVAELVQNLFVEKPPTAVETSLTIEEGGSGPYKSIATEDAELPGMTIFRPADLSVFGGDRTLPVLLWGNGACANTPDEHKNFLNEIASHGYFVLAIGPLQQLRERGPEARTRTTADQLVRALDWIEKSIQVQDGRYSGKVDITKVAAMGMSCGGLQAIAISKDPRIDTTVVCNSGVLPTPSSMPVMPSLTKEVLKDFHGPVLYIMGGPSDIAYKNAMDDFARVDHVPIVMTNLDVGHGGTYRQPRGGEFTRVALGWLDWQLKGIHERSKMFLGEDSELGKDSRWKIEVKNFK